MARHGATRRCMQRPETPRVAAVQCNAYRKFQYESGDGGAVLWRDVTFAPFRAGSGVKEPLCCHSTNILHNIKRPQGQLLPRVDNHYQVDNILRLAVFYQYIQTAALNDKQEGRHVSVFTTKLFAHYLHIKFLAATKCRKLLHTSLTDEMRPHIEIIYLIRRKYAALTWCYLVTQIVHNFHQMFNWWRLMEVKASRQYSVRWGQIEISWVAAGVCSWTCDRKSWVRDTLLWYIP